MALLVVELGGQRRSIPQETVREILPLGNLTPVPTAPPSVCGVVQVRGQVLAVLDLGPILAPGVAPRVARVGAPLVIVEPGSDGVRVALLVDRVPETDDAARAQAVPLDVAAALVELKRQVAE